MYLFCKSIPAKLMYISTTNRLYCYLRNIRLFYMDRIHYEYRYLKYFDKIFVTSKDCSTRFLWLCNLLYILYSPNRYGNRVYLIKSPLVQQSYFIGYFTEGIGVNKRLTEGWQRVNSIFCKIMVKSSHIFYWIIRKKGLSITYLYTMNQN